MKLYLRQFLLLAFLFLPTIGLAQETAPDYSAYILTPPAPDTPRINGPKVYGARPGAPFLFRIPATGVRPMTFGAKGLLLGTHLLCARRDRPGVRDEKRVVERCGFHGIHGPCRR